MAQTVPGAPAPPTTMTYEEFLEWADEDTRAEWVNGEVIMGSPFRKAQSIRFFLVTLVGLFVQSRQLGRVFYESFQ